MTEDELHREVEMLRAVLSMTLTTLISAERYPREMTDAMRAHFDALVDRSDGSQSDKDAIKRRAAAFFSEIKSTMP